MRVDFRSFYAFAGTVLTMMAAGCGGGGTQTPPPPVQTTYALTVNSSNPATGVSITASPADNDSKGSGSTGFVLTYKSGTSVTLTASATAGGNSFSSWSGCGKSSGETCTVTINANTTVTANYATPAPVTYALTVQSTNPASGVAISASPADTQNLTGGSTSFTLTYDAGTSVTLTAPATAGGNSFSSWSGCTSSSGATCSVTLNADTTVTAKYAAPATHVLTVKSAAPSSGVPITVSPADNAGAGNGVTPFTRTYNAGASITLSAALSFSGDSFVSWSGCTSNPAASTCDVTMNADTTVTATYNQAGITSISVSPATATIGSVQQFTATVNGNGSFSKSVTWSLSCPACGSLSAGTLSATGLYTTPYPAPPSVVITATSTQTPSISGSTTVALAPPDAASGPALSVDAGKPTHPISPYIYGMNAWSMASSVGKTVNLPVDRWGGDATSRYNYQLDVTNSASDWYFENNSAGAGTFNAQVQTDTAIGAKTMGTVPVLGFVARDSTSCSFPKSTYPNQVSFDQWRPNCGNGLYPQGVNGCANTNGCNITGNANVTDQAVGPSWAGNWVAYLVSKFGTAANGGVAIYDLDNEPAWWDAVHRDVHPLASTYDEVTQNGIATAKAIKAADPSAAVSGPVVDYWWNYFYSKKDIESGWGSGSPCWEPWSNPVDRQAHGGIPFVEYYLQQFKAAGNNYGARLLDYLDLHTYFAGTYNGKSVGLNTAGDTQEQKVRLDSTRVFWDPTYTDPNFPQPNYPSDSNYTTSCNTPQQAPQLIPMAQQWVANDYAGTKIAFTEYNWGGQESMNGAVAQADILGIFGKYGLDLATLWGPPDPATQVPGVMAFAMYRNYDGKNSMFGDTALESSSADQGKLAVYGAMRGSDGALTVMVINKTYGTLSSTISVQNLQTSSATAQVFQYSTANMASITGLSPVAVAAPVSGGTVSTITVVFPAQSITLLVVPK